jgi:hypothetical protein
MKIAIIAALGAFALSGCVTAQEMEARVAAKDDGDCRSYGAAPGTDGYLQCRMAIRQQHVEEYAAAAARSQAMMDNAAKAFAYHPAPFILTPSPIPSTINVNLY